MDQKWLLPEGVLELLPDQAERLEVMRRNCIDLYYAWGYRLVSPPLMEYLEALLTGSDQDLDLRTLKVMDQLSGRLMGIRADITPQVARMDAHTLADTAGQVNRLCYVGSVLHAKPSDLLSPRTFVQAGVEIYGHSGLESDRESLSLLIETCQMADPNAKLTINVGHLGLFEQMLDYFCAQMDSATLNLEQYKTDLLTALASKSRASLKDIARSLDLSSACETLLLDWVSCQGGLETLDHIAARFAHGLKDATVLDELKQTLLPVAEANPTVTWFLDFSEPQGYAYHTGLVYSAYVTPLHDASNRTHLPVASGGRYDGLGAPFGQERAATGFSADLLALVELGQAAQLGTQAKTAQSQVIWAPKETQTHPERNQLLKQCIAGLRQASKPVVCALSDDEQPIDGQPFLTYEGEDWIICENKQN